MLNILNLNYKKSFSFILVVSLVIEKAIFVDSGQLF